jgi:hypothetical protein
MPKASPPSTTIPLGAGTRSDPELNASDAAAKASAASELVASTPICSIFQLGEHLAAVGIAYSAHDLAALANNAKPFAPPPPHAKAMALLMDRGDALRGLIATMQAVTLADVAVQIGVAIDLASQIFANEIPNENAKDCAEAIDRMLQGMLPIVAAAAGLDMAAMDWSENAALRARRFAGVGAQL